MTKPFSNKISELRKARSFTQENLGERLGVSSQAVSKWEKGENMPDIMLLPLLCEILGVTADDLLEIPLSAKKENRMSNLNEYAKQAGECKAAFESLQACSQVSSDHKGSAQISKDGIRINNTNGYGFVIFSAEMLAAIQKVDYITIKHMCEYLNDENIIKVIQALDFTEFRSEQEIADIGGISKEDAQSALFTLLKLNFCECCIQGRYTFGVQSYVLFAILSGFYLASPEGHSGIYSVSRNYPPSDEK